jgi:hypothetical protein
MNAPSTTPRRQWLTMVGALVVLALSSSSASAAAPAEQYVIELRVIEGERTEAGDRGSAPAIDKRLSALAKDLSTLPFKRFSLKDSHTSVVQDGERVSLEIPVGTNAAKADKRFLVVSSHGRQSGGKLRFSLGIDALKFDTLVAVPDGGTIIVGGPRGKGGKVVLFAFTARARKS